MTPLEPGYGQTPVSFDELEALVPSVRAALGEPVSKAAVYDLEQGIEQQVTKAALADVLDGAATLDEVVSDWFLRDLHRRLYGPVWCWAGLLRRREVNIGVAPELIAGELRASLGTVLWRWRHTDDWTARQLGMAVHAETVRIHPFTDGNGRATRLLGDIAFAAAQDRAQPVELFDWRVPKRDYIDALVRYDRSRDPAELAALIPTRPIE